MGFFSNFLRFFKIDRKTKQTTHKDDLINNLLEDHRELVDLYVKIGNAYNNKEYRKVVKLLKKFEEMYKLHILLEDNKFYPFMNKKFEKNKEILELLRAKEKEMKEITKVLLKFVDKYTKESNLIEGSFLIDYENIKEALLTRVKFEETKMYPLYSE
jgi:hemerythrin-like domain-containing protein